MRKYCHPCSRDNRSLDDYKIISRQVKSHIKSFGEILSCQMSHPVNLQLEAFRKELADVLDWSTAKYEEGTVLMHT